MTTTKLAKAGALIAFLVGQLVLVLPAQASFIPVSIDALVNANLRVGYTSGSNYPIAPTTLIVGGVPFDLVPLDSIPESLGIIQNIGSETVPETFIIPLSVFGATTIYTLMNSAFGVDGANIATVEFTGTNGAFASFDLIEGNNIRDHFNGFFVNTVSDPSIVTVNYPPVNEPGDVRLDRQTFILPAAFATETLTQITFIGNSPDDNFLNGQAFLAAATVATPAVVPEPTATALLGIALIAAFFFLQRRRFANGRP
jgi:hypothetical protein